MLAFFLAFGPQNILGTQDAHLYSTWVPSELDTCASAWLIKKYVDPQAVFKFYPRGSFVEQGMAFDTPDAKWKRTQRASTFEAILAEYKIKDKALERIGQMIHEIEINYWAGDIEPLAEESNREILAIIKEQNNPMEIFNQSFIVLDKLYRVLQ